MDALAGWIPQPPECALRERPRWGSVIPWAWPLLLRCLACPRWGRSRCTHTELTPGHARSVVQRRCASHEGPSAVRISRPPRALFKKRHACRSRCALQFNNADNPAAHYSTTGPEIWRDTQGRITHFVSSMGTTGTVTGTSRYLKEMNPLVQVIGLQPEAGAQIPGIRRRATPTWA